jgi:hypothetical protein
MNKSCCASFHWSRKVSSKFRAHLRLMFFLKSDVELLNISKRFSPITYQNNLNPEVLFPKQNTSGFKVLVQLWVKPFSKYLIVPCHLFRKTWIVSELEISSLRCFELTFLDRFHHRQELKHFWIVSIVYLLWIFSSAPTLDLEISPGGSDIDGKIPYGSDSIYDITIFTVPRSPILIDISRNGTSLINNKRFKLLPT